jgi:hypothetical protein
VPPSLRLADLLAGLSVTASVGFGLPPEHAMRSCLMGTALGRAMGLDEQEVAAPSTPRSCCTWVAPGSRTRP